MLVIDEAKFPPPTPASAATSRNVVYDVPGSMTTAAAATGTSSIAALITVQLRPPNRATAKVYGTRSTPPTSVGIATRKNFPAGSIPYSGPMNSTITDHRLQMENPMCSDTTENPGSAARPAPPSPARSPRPPGPSARSSGRPASYGPRYGRRHGRQQGCRQGSRPSSRYGYLLPRPSSRLQGSGPAP